eukprot:GILI01011050.1.p1 GENE.GILI01011050.1~~GILI01011050.1.p1  ORF type:complete len:163 (-),score=43.83 GILI01011050.1:32-520(-)
MTAAAAKAAQAAGEKFLTEKAATPGVYKLPSGVCFTIIKKGAGEKSPLSSTPCKVHYKGTLLNNNVFDSSYKRNDPATFAPDQVIPGWTEVLQLMRDGDKWEIYVPAHLAYGAKGNPPQIPPYSTLVFTIELVRILSLAETQPATVADEYFAQQFGKSYADM